MTTTRRSLRNTALAAVAAAALALPGTAQAIGGSYTIVGATPEQAATVKAALKVTAFNWSCVPVNVKIVVIPGVESLAVPGTIQLDANLVDSGTFSWGVIQHEYAHQVDWYVLRPDVRTALAKSLGGATWGVGITSGQNVAHDDLTGERFANELAWSFWPSADNAIEPPVKTFTAKAFRGYLGGLIAKKTAAAPATAPATAPAAPATVAAVAAPAPTAPAAAATTTAQGAQQ